MRLQCLLCKSSKPGGKLLSACFSWGLVTTHVQKSVISPFVLQMVRVSSAFLHWNIVNHHLQKDKWYLDCMTFGHTSKHWSLGGFVDWNAQWAMVSWFLGWHDQLRSFPMPINTDRLAWLAWSAKIGIERYFGSMPGFWLVLISIGHWSRASWERWEKNLTVIN